MIALILGALLAVPASPSPPEDVDTFRFTHVPAFEHVESYRYEAVPTGRSRAAREMIEIEFRHHADGVDCVSRTTREDGVEVRKIAIDSSGQALGATRGESIEGVRDSTTSWIWREGGTASVERVTRQGTTRKDRDLPEGQPFAVDASLLYLLRSFPFETGETWKVFMADFEQHFVTVNVSVDGTESVIVPAGAFECFRVAVTVEYFLFRPRIWYWITRDPPHFLVRHEGKRGPFTPSYVTSLLSFESGSDSGDSRQFE